MPGPDTDPNNPQPSPGNPNPEPARPPLPAEPERPDEPPGVPPPTPDPIPGPGNDPVEIPPSSPPEIPPGQDFPAPTAALASRRAVRPALLLSAVAGVFLLGHPALAQSQQQDEPRAEAPCQAAPENKSGDRSDPQSGDGADRSGKMLERCNGVLQPPATGDPAVKPPPEDTGATPVIPPGVVPQQPSQTR